MDPSLMKWNPKPEMHFQFERVGFFVVDKDSDIAHNKYVLNLTVTLKDVNKPKGGVNDAGTAINTNKSRKDEQDKQLAAKMVCDFVA